MEIRDSLLLRANALTQAQLFIDAPFVSIGQTRRRIEEASESVTYVGYSAFGVTTDDPRWVVQKITETGNLTTLEYAVNIEWDDRATATYM